MLLLPLLRRSSYSRAYVHRPVMVRSEKRGRNTTCRPEIEAEQQQQQQQLHVATKQRQTSGGGSKFGPDIAAAADARGGGIRPAAEREAAA